MSIHPSEEFLASADRSVLLLRRCEACGTTAPPDVDICPRCRSARLGWAESAGRGRLISWTVAHPKPPASVRILAVAELAEGPWWWADLEGVEVDELREGLEVVVGWRDVKGIGRVPILSAY